MATYSPNIAMVRKKVRKVHKKARLVGILYLLGTLAAIVLSFLPCLKIQFASDESTLFIGNFFRPFLWIFGGNFTGVLVFLLYFILIISNLVYLFRIFAGFRRVMKKNDKNVNACNRNVSAMEEMGVTFSRTVFTIVLLYMLMFVVTPSSGSLLFDRNKSSLELFGILLVAVAVLIHFVAGAIGATCSIFMVGVSIEEKTRPDGVFVYIIRSFIKIVAAFALAAMVLPVCTIHEAIPNIFEFNFDALMPDGDIMPLLGLVLQILAVVFISLCMKHALSALEFNLVGMDAYGMRRYAVFALISGIICIGAFIVDKNWKAEPPTMIYNYLVAGVVAIVVFVLDFIVKPRVEAEEEENMRDWKAVKEDKKAPKEAPAAPQPQPVNVGIPTSIDLNLNLPEPPKYEMNASETKWEVTCPTCGKELMVKEAPYHRCPGCGKVFCLSLGKIESAETKTLEQEMEENSKPEKKKKLFAKKEKKAKKVVEEK